MKVTTLKPIGYCAGVEKAINIALKTKKDNSDKEVVVLGMLVHNQDALKTLENAGIKTVYDKNKSLEELAKLIVRPSIVILTAHGHSKKVEDILNKNGHKIVDATCPFVNKSFDIINDKVIKNKDIFYIGIKNHPEALAALSLSDKVHFVDAIDPIIPSIKESPFIISQTTLSFDEVKNIIELIQKQYKDAEILEGICHASTERQNAIKNIDKDVDGIFIVGGKNSNNSKTLYNLAKKLYPNKYVSLIENVNEINEKDLLGLKHIAISSGASTPKEIIDEIVEKLSD